MLKFKNQLHNHSPVIRVAYWAVSRTTPPCGLHKATMVQKLHKHTRLLIGDIYRKYQMRVSDPELLPSIKEQEPGLCAIFYDWHVYRTDRHKS